MLRNDKRVIRLKQARLRLFPFVLDKREKVGPTKRDTIQSAQHSAQVNLFTDCEQVCSLRGQPGLCDPFPRNCVPMQGMRGKVKNFDNLMFDVGRGVSQFPTLSERRKSFFPRVATDPCGSFT